MRDYTATQKQAVRAEAIRLWSHKAAQNPMIRRDGSVVVSVTTDETAPGKRLSCQIFVGWAEDMLADLHRRTGNSALLAFKSRA